MWVYRLCVELGVQTLFRIELLSLQGAHVGTNQGSVYVLVPKWEHRTFLVPLVQLQQLHCFTLPEVSSCSIDKPQKAGKETSICYASPLHSLWSKFCSGWHAKSSYEPWNQSCEYPAPISQDILWQQCPQSKFA